MAKGFQRGTVVHTWLLASSTSILAAGCVTHILLRMVAPSLVISTSPLADTTWGLRGGVERQRDKGKWKAGRVHVLGVAGVQRKGQEVREWWADDMRW